MAKPSDFVVELRDVNFQRQGQIDTKYLDIKFTDIFNGVGTWELKLPADYPKLPVIQAKGSGIVITDRVSGRIYSGRTKTGKLSQNATDPDGTWVFTGVQDNIVAAATVVYPDPANLANAQTTATWDQSGVGELVMKLAVQANIGSTAIASRKYSWLTVGANLNRGATVKCSSRFDGLGDLLTSLASAAGLGWYFYQQGAGLTFEVYVPQDKRALVRLDIRNGGIQSNELGYTAPTATTVLVMGQGEGALRTILPVTTTAAQTEATNWGLRWEATKDQRQTNDTTALTQAGTEDVTAAGSTVNTLKVTPSDAPNQTLGKDWYIGDRITVTVNGVPADAQVTQVATSIGSAGVIRQATIGDPANFSFDAKVVAAIQDQDQRIGQVERLVGTTPAATTTVPGTVALATVAEFKAGTSAAKAVTPADAAHMTIGADLPAATDLDTMATTGQFHQATPANATLALHYPLASVGGMLVVEASLSGTTPMLTQTYITRLSGTQSRVFTRSKYNTGSWSSWMELTRPWAGTLLPAFQVQLHTVQTRSGASGYTKIAWDTVLLNQGSYWDTTNKRFVAPVAGLYEFVLSITQNTNVGGPMGILAKNGNAIPSGAAVSGSANVATDTVAIAYYNYVTGTGTMLVPLAANDYIEAYLYNGNNLTVTIGNYGTAFSGRLIEAN